MVDLCYPVFEEGQTLTRDDLTDLREFVEQRARLVGRAVGFGVACGLGGEIGGNTLVIEAGVAIDQDGEILTLDAEAAFPLPVTATAGAPTFEFISGTSGFTAVLVLHTEETKGKDCGDATCQAHAGVACLSAKIVWVRGKVTRAQFDAQAEPLLVDNQPLAANPTVAQFAALRSAIVQRLHDRISAAMEAKLAAMEIKAADIVAVRNHKAAFLNLVMFATLDLLRCEVLMGFACLRETKTPGVALGWLHQDAGVWTWDCERRHAFEPPAGLSLALVGGHCDDPCSMHRLRIESLIDTFVVPTAPAPDDPPTPGPGGPYLPCKPYKNRTKPGLAGFTTYFDDCGIIQVPPLTIDPQWKEPWLQPQPYWPPWYDPVDPQDIYGNPQPDWLETGLIKLDETYGRDPSVVQPALETAIVNAGMPANIKVLKTAEADKLTGYLPTAAVSPADTIVLGIDAKGKITTTGHIPAQVAVTGAALAGPAALTTASQALTVTQGLQQTVGSQATVLQTHTTQLGTFSAKLTGLEQFQLNASQSLAGIDAEISHRAESVLADYQVKLATMLDGALLDAVGKIQGQLSQQIEQQSVAYVAPLQVELSTLAARVGESLDEATKANVRIDQVLTGRASGMGFAEIDRQAKFNEGMVGFLRTARAAVEAAAPDAQREKVRGELAAGERALAHMEAGVRAGSVVLADERAALSEVVDSFVAALRVSEVPAAEMKAVQLKARGLMETIR